MGTLPPTLDNGRTRTVHFGSAGASDYTQHRNLVRKQQYLARHAPREEVGQPYDARRTILMGAMEQRDVKRRYR